ncbi:1-aminocyclopropane-1-carboxylate deaminase [Pedobacter yulinensis]|uniref:1-aminocyclopropane-1-carboxylate deaminase n=1 Tax=Pedobacter yulinensis TaxID=2126353 RepID=A0A2T3HID6_9SPHI|nr:pyridoxal-phosphate dependent enzyme [Pedobacter yulinensis]PST82204.1 1-aminocyclopropane-1-carboxylate deaminase [Pedobacter yulinensis]
MLLPSPVHQIILPSGAGISVKRDDLIDPYVSGNKWRKLKYHLNIAGAQGKTHLVTFGGAWSNHLLATAAAAARYGFSATGYVRGELAGNELLFLCSLFGMRLVPTERSSYRDKHQIFEHFHGSEEVAYFIDEGGSGEPAVQGCTEIIAELNDRYDHIVVAAGTGTTAAGLLTGIVGAGLHTRLHVIPVLKPGGFLAADIGAWCSDTSQLSLHTDYHFGGYAKTTPELLRFIAGLARNTGMLTDPVYTGKMFFALNDLIVDGVIDQASSILAIHTGGLTGLLGKRQAFSS